MNLSAQSADSKINRKEKEMVAIAIVSFSFRVKVCVKRTVYLDIIVQLPR